MVSQVGINVPNKKSGIFAKPDNGWYLTAHPDEEHKKNSHKLAWGISIATLVLGFGVFALARGSIGKYLTPYLEKLKAVLDKKIESNSSLKGIYQKISNGITSGINSLQTLNNYTSIKDMLFQKLMYKTEFTRKIHKFFTRVFNNMSRGTVNSSYAGADKKFTELNQYILDLNSRILGKHPKKTEFVQGLSSDISGINKQFNEGFGIQARTDRLKRIEDETNNIFQDVWNRFGNLDSYRSKNMYQTFIAEERMLPFKNGMISEVARYREALNQRFNSILSKYKEVLSDAEYVKLEKEIKSVMKSLDGAIETETVKYVDKARDLKLGAAPTDILSILLTIIPVGWFLGRANSNEERVSSALKYGIPVIGAITTSLICTGKLISGGKARAIALLSGWLMNRAGTYVDDTRKKYKIDISLENKTLVKPQSYNG